MATKYLTEPVIWDSYSDDSLFSELGIPREPIIDKRDGKYRVRVFDGVTPGGNPIAGGLLSGVYKPSIVSPADTVTGISFSPILTASAYGAVNITADPHGSTRWQVASNSLFTNIIFDSNTDTVNLEMIDLSNESIVLDPETTYYVRVKYTSTTDKESEWSAISSFITKPPIVDGLTSTRMLSPNPIGQDTYGRYMAISGDGNVLAIWAYDKQVGGFAGCFHMYDRINNAWVYINKISGGMVNPGYDGNIQLTENGDTLFVGLQQQASTGKVFVFKRVGGVYSKVTEIIPSDGMTDGYFGSSISITPNADRLVIGSGRYNTYKGKAYIFNYNSDTELWDEGQHITPTVPINNNYFGHYGTKISPDASSIVIRGGAYSYIFNYNGSLYTEELILTGTTFGDSAFSGDGNTLAIGVSGDNLAGTNKGAVRVYSKVNGVWSITATILPPPTFGILFGYRVKMTSDGQTLFISSDQRSTNGQVCIYVRSGNDWTLQNTIFDDGSNGPYATFGEDIVINNDGSLLVLGAWGSNYQTGANYTGCVYTFD